jgi:glutathione synthase/RimK-type ligase-like ATP-grasp enzyme
MLIHFATSPDLPELTIDDTIAADELRRRGFDVEPLIWSDEMRRAGDAVVIRSCWDYHLNEPAFRSWISRLERDDIPVINSATLLRWNLHKSYIMELAARGIAVVPTVAAGAADARSLDNIIRDSGWQEAVVKPAVSLSAYETWRVTEHDAATHEDRFVRLRSRGDVLVQSFVHEVTTAGEWSLMFFGSSYSHAVRKLPKSGDFRVQIEHGGSVTSELPPAGLIAQAARVIEVLPERASYCRVDGVMVNDAFIVMEVECIDPVLFFELHPPAAELFADEVMRRITLEKSI